MKITFLKISAFVLFFALIGAGCKKEYKTPSDIVLYDKPLSVIQSCIKGKWRLQYTYGGFSVQKYIARNNSYMVLSPDHIILGDDSRGVVLDTAIVWKRIDLTWEFRYFSVYQTATEIKNDTLIIRDDLDDGFAYYYTKY